MVDFHLDDTSILQDGLVSIREVEVTLQNGDVLADDALRYGHHLVDGFVELYEAAALAVHIRYGDITGLQQFLLGDAELFQVFIDPLWSEAHIDGIIGETDQGDTGKALYQLSFGILSDNR